MTNVVEALVPGGKATPGPPLGPALGPLGINIKDVIAQINEKTKEYNGMDVPVKVIVDDDKNVEVEVGTPPTSALIMKEVGIDKGSGDVYGFVGNLSLDQILKITRLKRDDVLSYSSKNAMKEIVGTCVTIGVTVEGMSPKDFQKSIDQGNFDDAIGAEE
ncbi:MAG: 50S ribosomal protein L11 [Methanohalobium sp.]|uniref:50S ribosomal protein L11 n=1 Tax=Methanohalobium sp. TaxID=2837493 RepID=UPI00397BD90E